MSGSLQGSVDRFLVAAVVAGDELGDLVVEQFRARQFREPALDVTRRGGGVAGEDVAEVSLAFDEVTLVRQHHERVADGRVAVRMILHRVTDDVGDLDEAAVVLLVQRPQDAPLHRLQAVGQVRDGAVADDIGGVIEEPAIHPRVQARADLFRIERLVRDGRRQNLCRHVRLTVAVGGGLGGAYFLGHGGRLTHHREFRLVRIFLTSRHRSGH